MLGFKRVSTTVKATTSRNLKYKVPLKYLKRDFEEGYTHELPDALFITMWYHTRCPTEITLLQSQQIATGFGLQLHHLYFNQVNFYISLFPLAFRCSLMCARFAGSSGGCGRNLPVQA